MVEGRFKKGERWCQKRTILIDGAIVDVELALLWARQPDVFPLLTMDKVKEAMKKPHAGWVAEPGMSGENAKRLYGRAVEDHRR